MSRRKPRYGKHSREPGGFVALPWSVLDSSAYQRLSHAAKALLLEVARQYHQDDNGRMLLSWRYLKPRGWPSPETILRAKRELLEAGLLYETVKGQRPNRASWFACTWLSLDPNPDYDAGAEQGFVRGAYRLIGGIAKTPAPNTPAVVAKNTSLNTAAVVARASIDTATVLGKGAATTAAVSMRPIFTPLPTTATVHPLEKPSAARESGVGGGAVNDIEETEELAYGGA